MIFQFGAKRYSHKIIYPHWSVDFTSIVAHIILQRIKLLSVLRIAVLLFCLDYCFNFVTAINVNTLTINEGLASNTVRTVIQDSRGFLWFGTDNGLCRYDGIVIKHYFIDNLGSNQFISTLYDAPDQLYIGTDSGVFCLNYATETFQKLSSEIHSTVSCITAENKSGALWISTLQQGVFRYVPHGGKLKNFPLKIFNGFVSQVFVDRENRIWAVTHTSSPSLAKLDKVRDDFVAYSFKDALIDHKSLCMMQTNDGTLWLGTWENGLIKMRKDGILEQVLSSQDVALLNHIHTLYEYLPGHILVGCDRGVMEYNIETGQIKDFFDDRYGISGVHFVYSICQDVEKDLWFGTFYGGVSFVSPMSQRFQTIPTGVISRFCEAGTNRIWIASDDKGLLLYDLKEKRFMDYPGQEAMSNFNIHALCMDGNDLWIGTYSGGVYVLNTRNGNIRHFVPDESSRSLDGIHSYCIFRDSKRRIWVATQKKLFLYRKESGDFVNAGQFSHMIIDIDEDNSGDLWLSTQGDGLWRYCNDGTKKHYLQSKEGSGLAGNQINCVLIDNNSNLWVGTDGGLCLYDPPKDSFQKISLNTAKLEIRGIVEEQGVLWITSKNELIKYNLNISETPNALKYKHYGKSVKAKLTENLVCFTREDGLSGGEFQPNSCYKSSNGYIYFGSTAGISMFIPDQIEVNTIPVRPAITSVEILNNAINVGERNMERVPEMGTSIELSYKDKMIGITFSALSYTSRSKNQYAYMLEGFDKQWNYVGTQTKAIFTNLKSGKYVFRVKATNNDGIWSEEDATMTLIVHAPLWWNTWTKIIYLLILIILVYLLIRYKAKKQERSHKLKLRELSDKKEKEVREARLMFFTMIAHEIRTPVSLIIGPLENIQKKVYPAIKADLDIMERNAKRLLDLVNQLLDFRKIEEHGFVMRFAPQDVSNVIRNIEERFLPTFQQKGISFIVDYPDSNITACIDKEAITKVVSNLLTNASKYTRNKVRLSITENKDLNTFQIAVTDNGKGIKKEDRERVFTPFYQAQNNKPGIGIGLSIVKDIVEKHNGKVKVDSISGCETTFTVILPLTQQDTILLETDTDFNKETNTTPQENTTIVGDRYSQKQNLSPKSSQNEEGVLEIGNKKSEEIKPLLLIVDDNEDMVEFLKNSFCNEYRIFTASDGIEALEQITRIRKASEGLPESSLMFISLIICDWMMPRMDGKELCKQIKRDPTTSHIPFIMLTAKTDDSSKVEGMDIGADIYIEKPFSPVYLRACIHNIIATRRRLRLHYTTQPFAPIEELSGNDIDKDFLHRFNDLIEQNFSKNDISVTFLASQMGVSRSGLFAKLKELTDLTPNEMIQIARLKKAAMLLRQGNYQIGEVCYTVGFSNPSYFTKCFVKQFGIKPSEFVVQSQIEKRLDRQERSEKEK